MAQYRVQQWATFARMWWVYDAKWQDPYKSAHAIIKHLQGLHKPIFHPLSDIGDHVVVINTKEIAMEGQKWRTRKFYHHTGYPGGFSAIRAYKVHDADPTKVLSKAVYHYMENTLLRRGYMARMHLYPDEEVPDDILKNITGQIPQVMTVPKRLDEYTEREQMDFPQLFDWPEEEQLIPGKLGKRKQ